MLLLFLFFLSLLLKMFAGIKKDTREQSGGGCNGGGY